MSKALIEELLRKTGVIMEGHFQLTSGKHSELFLQCSKLLQHPRHTTEVCRLMAEPFREAGVATVVGPAMGGVILSYETARALGARALYAEKQGETMLFRRGFKLAAGERVLVVEDAVTTGGSVQKVLELLRACRAEIVGVTMIVDRSAGRVDFGVPTTALLTMNVEAYDPAGCPLCRKGLPLQKPKS